MIWQGFIMEKWKIRCESFENSLVVALKRQARIQCRRKVQKSRGWGGTKLIWNNFVVIMVPRCWKYVCHIFKICTFCWENGNNLLKSKKHSEIYIRIVTSIFLCNFVIEMILIFLHLGHNLVIFRLRFLNLVHYGGRGIKKIEGFLFTGNCYAYTAKV